MVDLSTEFRESLPEVFVGGLLRSNGITMDRPSTWVNNLITILITGEDHRIS